MLIWWSYIRLFRKFILTIYYSFTYVLKLLNNDAVGLCGLVNIRVGIPKVPGSNPDIDSNFKDSFNNANIFNTSVLGALKI